MWSGFKGAVTCCIEDTGQVDFFRREEYRVRNFLLNRWGFDTIWGHILARFIPKWRRGRSYGSSPRVLDDRKSSRRVTRYLERQGHVKGILLRFPCRTWDLLTGNSKFESLLLELAYYYIKCTVTLQIVVRFLTGAFVFWSFNDNLRSFLNDASLCDMM